MASKHFSLRVSDGDEEARLSLPDVAHKTPDSFTSSTATMPPNPITVHTSVLFNPKGKAFLENMSIEVDRDTGAIVRLFQRDTPDLPPGRQTKDGDIDLRDKFVLPGLVDSHTHIFLHAYKERPSAEQMRDESAVERVVRATNHARSALLAGYTTYRDLGTEALGAADAGFRDCVNRGLTPGPRLFVATEALASSGGYAIRVENRVGLGGGEGGTLVVPRAADTADGVAGVRAAVRRRIGDGADLIKVYSDYRRRVLRFPPDVKAEAPGGRILFPPAAGARNPSVPLYSQEELDAIVDEARRAEAPVAAHAVETRAALMAARAGVATVEHVMFDSDGILDRLLDEMRARGTIWVPTLATAELLPPHEFRACKLAVKKAYDRGVRLAAGADTGTFNHGLNAREIEIMVEAGIPVEEALFAATYRGWEACGGDTCGFRFGWFEEGNRADIIALDADPRKDVRALRKVTFVMKDGRVWKRDVLPVDMVTVPQWPDDDGNSSDEWSDVNRPECTEMSK